MANTLTKNVRDYMIYEDKLDIPYDGVGFVKWLTEVKYFSSGEAEKQVKIIRDMDIELWESGDPEIFQMIASWMADARNAKSETVRNLMYDFIFITLESEVDDFMNMRKDFKKKSLPFIDSVIEAYKLYISYFKDILGSYPEDMDEIMEMEEEEEPSKQKYPSVPLEEEYKKYLEECRFPPNSRYKMLTNLRKLNALVINNGRGESDWLKAIAEKAQSGINIRYTRFTADHLIHSVIENNPDKCEASAWALKGGLTALNHYLDFLIRIYKSKQDRIYEK